MEKFVLVQGQRRLNGCVKVQGSKNAALPLIAAAVNCAGLYHFDNVPMITDISTLLSIFGRYGVKYELIGHTLRIDAREVFTASADKDTMNLRASSYLIGALLPRTGTLETYSPGGCRIGARPLDIHFAILKRLGGRVEKSGNTIQMTLKECKPIDFELKYRSVGATINAIMLCSYAKGVSIIKNAASEPEVDSVISFYNAVGVKVRRRDNDIIIEGKEKRKNIYFKVPFDRIVFGDLLLMAIATKSKIEIEGVNLDQQKALIVNFSQSSCQIGSKGDKIYIREYGKLCGSIITDPYPMFPTDLQAQFVAACLATKGWVKVRENVFGSRFNYASELRKMGAEVLVDNDVLSASSKGLVGCEVFASDLRSGMALMIAGLAAKGETKIGNSFYLDRGYEDIVGLVNSLGGEVKRIE